MKWILNGCCRLGLGYSHVRMILVTCCPSCRLALSDLGLAWHDKTWRLVVMMHKLAVAGSIEMDFPWSLSDDLFWSLLNITGLLCLVKQGTDVVVVMLAYFRARPSLRQMLPFMMKTILQGIVWAWLQVCRQIAIDAYAWTAVDLRVCIVWNAMRSWYCSFKVWTAGVYYVLQDVCRCTCSSSRLLSDCTWTWLNHVNPLPI